MDNRKQHGAPPGSGGERIEPARFVPPPAKKPVLSFAMTLRTGLAVLALALGALLVAFIAWFMLTAAVIEVETEPADAAISLDGGMGLRLAGRHMVRPGPYRLSLAAPGYEPLSAEIMVHRGPAQRHVYQLEKRPGRLRVDTGAVTGAEVFVDQEAKGKTPLLIEALPAGKRLVAINAPRHLPYEEQLEITGLDQEQTLEVALTPAWAEVSFDAEPQGAEVFSGEESLGKTPLTAELLAGEHAVMIKAPGHQTWRETIKVVANQPLRLDGIRLERAAATLFVASEPARASATVDGEYAGLTPLELSLRPGREAAIRLYKQGYKPALRTFTAKAGREQRLRVVLEPELVSVALKVQPADAQLYLDGALIGEGDRVLQLPAKKHRLELRKEGYAPHKATLTPHIGVEQELNIRLKTLRQVKMENVKPVIKTAGGQTLKLFHPGAFTMGASRREPGRRPNETLRRTRLTRPFYLGLTEVTNGAYRLFQQGFSSGRIDGNNLNGDKQPAANLSWRQAALFCNWLSQQEDLTPFYRVEDDNIAGFDKNADGYRLPTEAEWAWAARVSAPGGGGAGAALLKFPWGPAMPPGRKSGNFADRSAAALLGRIIDNYDDGFAVSAPVGSFAANGKGLFDLGGNVAEWTHDFYDIAVSAGQKAAVDPLGPLSGEFHVIRGSSWAHGTVTELRLSFRDYGSKAREDVGFRLARYPY